MYYFSCSMNKDLDNYIHDQLAQGVSNSAITQALLTAGWKEEDVDAALRSAASSTANKDSADGAVTAHTTVDHPHIAEQPVAEKPHSSDGHSRKLIVFGAVAAVIVLILAGAGFVYAYYASPAHAFLTMRNKMAAVKMFTYNGAISGNVVFADLSAASPGNAASSSRTTNTPINLTFSGSADVSRPSSPAVSLNIQSGSFGLQSRIIGSDGYFRISGMPFAGQWIKTSQNALSTTQQSKTLAQLSHDLTPTEKLAVQNDLAMLYGQIYGSDVRQFSSGTISGQAMRHYQITLDKWTAARLVNDFAEQQSGKSLNLFQYLGDSAILGGIQNITADVWIGQQDMFAHRVLYTIPLADTYPLAGGTLKLDITLDNFNKPVAITPPASAVNLQDVANSLLPLMMGSGPSSRLPFSSGLGGGTSTPTLQ